MPGLKTRKRIKKEGSDPIQTMGTGPSLFRPHAFSAPSDAGHPSKHMAQPALQLKRSRSARSFKDISIQRSQVAGMTLQRDDDPKSTSPSTRNSSGSGNRSATIKAIAQNIVSPKAQSIGLQPDSQLADEDPSALKSAGDSFKSNLNALTKGDDRMQWLAQESMVEAAQKSEGSAPLPMGNSGGGPSSTVSVDTAHDEDYSISPRPPRLVSGPTPDLNPITTRERRTAGDYEQLAEQSANNAEAWHGRKDKAATARTLTGMTVPSGLGRAAELAGGSATLVSQMTAIANIIFAPIDAVLNTKAAIRSGQKISSLEALAQRAKNQGHDEVLVDAIQYAISQKYKKMIARLASLCANLVTFGTSVAVLATGGAIALLSNPVGWSILTGIAAAGILIASAVTLYYIGRWIWKKCRGTLGVLRRQMAITLFEKLKGSNSKDQSMARQVLNILMGEDKATDFADSAQFTEEEAINGIEVERSQLASDIRQYDTAILTANFLKRQGLKKKKKAAKKRLKSLASKVENIRGNQARQRHHINDARAGLVKNRGKLDRLKEKRQRTQSTLDALLENHSAQPDSASGSNSTKKVARLIKKIKSYDSDIQSLTQKRQTMERQQDWKSYSKLDRNRIKQIERKLKNW